MFDEGSLFWILSIVLRHQLFIAILFIFLLGVGYSIHRLFSIRFNEKMPFHLKDILFSIIISQVIILVLSVAYVSYYLNWSLFPHAADAVRFLNSHYHFVILAINIQIGFLLCAIVLKLRSNLKWADFGFRKSEIRTVVMIKLIISGITIILFTSYFSLYFKDCSFEYDKTLENILLSIDIKWKYSYTIWLIIVSPVIEEIFFRGIMFSMIRQFFGIKTSLILQAFLFAIGHYEIDTIIIMFVSGMVLGYSYYKSKSLISPIIVHSLQNLFAFL